MRIVLSAFGTRGETRPFVVLGSELMRRGHDVVVSGLREFAPLAEAQGVPYAPCELDARVAELVRRGVVAALQGSVAWDDRREFFTLFGEAVHAEFDALRTVAPGADLVVGTGMDMAFRSMGEAVGARVRYVAFTPTVFPSAYHAPLAAPRFTLGRPLNRLAWWLYERVSVAPNEERVELGLPPVRWAYPDAMAYDLRPLLAADEEVAPLAPDLAGRVVHVPAILPCEDERLPADLEAFLAGGDAPVFLGFGDMPARNPARLTRDVISAVRALGLRIVVGSGWARLAPEGVRDVFVCEEVARPSLFRRCVAVVHHGGAETTAQACRSGVPQIVVPHFTDQYLWAARVVKRGLGMKVPRRHLSAGSLRARLQHVVGDERYSFSAKAMAERLGHRDGTREAADALLA